MEIYNRKIGSPFEERTNSLISCHFCVQDLRIFQDQTANHSLGLSSYGLIVTGAMESIVPILLGFELSSTGHDPVSFISVAEHPHITTTLIAIAGYAIAVSRGDWGGRISELKVVKLTRFNVGMEELVLTTDLGPNVEEFWGMAQATEHSYPPLLVSW
ncbi:hypothetical protein Cgig2_018261 [Carnegiea gigantea]|uniref:Uncharacterized protein n=1 Tax=Carnegiea gigantea TaxID=171969 RepID=A0A9Q1KXS5_9CARY|nr:hypothetical protein Cgig2_018261 [Carnegiea gigantea]